MTRYLCWLAVLGVAALPDWATACRPLWVIHRPCAPVHFEPVCPTWQPMYFAPPVFCPPVWYPPPACWPAPMPMYAAPAMPTAPMSMLPPPRVEQGPKLAAPSPAPAEMGKAAPKRLPATPPQTEPIRPIGGTNSGTTGGANSVIPATPATPAPNFPRVEIPKELGPLPKAEPLKSAELIPVPVPVPTPTPTQGEPAPARREPAPAPLPPIPGEKANGPSLVVPMNATPAPSLPSLDLPVSPAPATPAPAPAAEPLIPSPTIPAPTLTIPDPLKPDMLPSLTLPPDSPVAPAKDSTSRSSPLTGWRAGPSVHVFPADRSSANGVYRSIGFYNHTARDLELTIEGRAVSLPAKSYLQAKLGASFTWSHSHRPAVRETVPTDAGGLDFVFQ